MQHDELATSPELPARDFFALQFAFAAAASAATGLSLEEALLSYTSFYLRFRLPRPIDAANPGWREYLLGLRQARDPQAWTWRYFTSRARPPSGEHAGCFAYHLQEPGAVHLHFESRDRSGESPLAPGRLPARRDELRAMFRTIAERHPHAVAVRGGSWLYNLASYRSLFPPAFLLTAYPVARFQAADRWGQFLDRRGRVRPAMAEAFLGCVARQRTLEGLAACFPHQVLALECPIAHFYALYGIRAPD